MKETNLPPETSVNSSSTTKHAAGHLVGISAGNAGRVDPDLVAQTGNVEAGEVSAAEPLGPHGSAIAARRRGPLLDQENALASLAKLIRERNATSAGADNDVVICLSWRSGASGLVLLTLTRRGLKAGGENVRQTAIGVCL